MPETPFVLKVGRFSLPNPHPDGVKVRYKANAEILSVLLWPDHDPPAGDGGSGPRRMYFFECQGEPQVWNNMLKADGTAAAEITVTAQAGDGGRFLVEVNWPDNPEEVKQRCPFVAVVQSRCTQNEQYLRSEGLHHQVASVSGHGAGGDLDGGKDLDI